MNTHTTISLTVPTHTSPDSDLVRFALAGNDAAFGLI